ncbi:hypothetical protein ARTHRO9V_240158 [Arthrobacter sp. 9V]|nr:hypothetical protein ARTHRO9V_240158 [Arthrobacter sp. 9V]
MAGALTLLPATVATVGLMAAVVHKGSWPLPDSDRDQTQKGTAPNDCPFPLLLFFFVDAVLRLR